MTMSVGIEMKSPFSKRTYDAEKAAAKTERELAKLPYGLQVRDVGDEDWRTIAKGPTLSSLFGLADACERQERRLLHRNTIVLPLKAGEKVSEKAGQQ